MPKTKKNVAMQHSIYVPKDLEEKIEKYKIENNKTFSEVVNIALQDYFKIHANKDELTITTDIIRNVIKSELDPFKDRLIKLQVKSTKTGYSSEYLLVEMLAFFQNHLKDIYFRNENDLNLYLKDKIKKADEMGYKATTSKEGLDDDLYKLAKDLLE